MKTLKNTAIIILITIGLLVLLEGITRIFRNQRTELAIISGHEKALVIDSAAGTFRHNPGVKYRQTTAEFTIDYQINSEGMRDPNTYLDKPRDSSKVRVLAIGDSFTYGEGSEIEETWLTRLENSPINGKQVEIIKAGVRGYDQYHEYKYLQDIIDRYAPDVILLGFLPNDLQTNIPLTEKRSPANLTPSDHGISRSFIGRLQIVSLVKHLLLSNDAIYRTAYEYRDGASYLSRGNDLVQDQFKVTDDLLEQIDILCDAKGIPLVVVSIPQFYEVIAKEEGYYDYNHIDEYFSVTARKYDFRWLTTIQEFRAAYKSAIRTHYRVDGHLTPQGNEVLARVVKQKLEAGAR